MGTCSKADGSGSVVLRNSTTLVMHMKVYDESIQLGRCEAGRPLGAQGQQGSRPELQAAGPWGKGVRVRLYPPPKGAPCFLTTKAPYRLPAALFTRPGAQEDRKPESWVGW